jgi:hypothetical protein
MSSSFGFLLFLADRSDIRNERLQGGNNHLIATGNLESGRLEHVTKLSFILQRKHTEAHIDALGDFDCS